MESGIAPDMSVVVVVVVVAVGAAATSAEGVCVSVGGATWGEY